MTVTSNTFSKLGEIAENSQSFTVANKSQPLHSSVREALQNYFTQLKGEEPINLYKTVLAEMEAPLLGVVMSHLKGNQSRAAILLGLSRGTLRHMLKVYGIIN